MHLFISPLSYTLTGITANGGTHTVSASFSAASCSKNTTYTAPASCTVSSCTVSLTAIPGTCEPATNTYSVSGRATIFNARGGSTITFTDGATSQSYTVPSSQVSTTWVDYTLSGFSSNGSSHTVTAVVSNGASCSGTTTYNAPMSCLCTNPTPSVNSPTICSGSSATLTVSNCAGTVTWNDGMTWATRTFSPTATTTYTATCSVGTCTGTASGTVTVIANPTPSVNNSSICSGSSATLSVSNCAGSVTWNDGVSGSTRTVNPTSTTTYTATCSVGTCTGTASGTITVTTASNPTPSVNSPTICSGSSATLTVSNCAGSVTWNDGTTGLTKTVSPTTTTSYTATCTVTNGNCTGTGTASGTVTVTPKPTPSVTSPSICAGSSATLSVSNCAGSITWNDGVSGSTRTVSPTSTTTYTATCSVGTCTGTATGTVTVTTVANPTPSVNSPTICSGSSATLTVSNCAGTVTWNDGTTGLTKTVSPTTTTSYTATCTVTTGNCTGTGTATGTVTVTPKPTPSVNSPTICSGSSATLTVSNCAGSVTWNDGTTGATKTVSPTSTTTYSATCTVGTCTGTASGTVTVTTASNPTPSVNSPTICAGSSATLTVSNCAGTVTWNDGTTGLTKTVSPTTTTSYTATCTVTTGNCSGTGTATGTVTVTPKPTPSVNSPTICTGSSATLTVSNCAGTVTWNDGVSGSSRTVSPTSTTTYAATCSVGTCTGTASGTVTTASNPMPSINNPTICAGSSATLTVSNCAGSVTWNDGTTGLTKTVSPTTTTSYTATCTVTTGNCTGTGTATGTVTVTPKPTPSVNSPTICAGSSATLTVSNCAGSVTWNDGTTGSTKTVSPTATTTYTATCSVGTCTGTATGTVTVRPLPAAATPSVTQATCNAAGTAANNDAGISITGITNTNVYSYTVDGSTPAFANATTLSGGAINLTNLANPASAVTYKFRLYNTSADCYTEVSAILNPKTCNNPKGSLGDFVWKDINNNGIQDESTPNAGGVAGVQIELYKNGVYFAKDTTDATGHYLFTNLDAGTYKIKVLSTSIPAGCEISTLKDMGIDDAKDSDVDKTTGFSGDYVIDPTDPTKKDILTVDAALAVSCVKSKVTLTGAPVCSADVQTYSISFSVTGKNGFLKVSKGTLSGSNPYTVTGIPSGASIKITDSLSAVCKFDTIISALNCNCNPSLPTLLTPSMTVCIGDTFPTLKASVVGLATVEWFATATSTTVLFTGLNYKPAGTVTSTGAVFYAQARSTDPSCPVAISTGRVMATINAQDCNKEVDLALKKSINTKIAQIGDVLTYTLEVWNESGTNATGVEVTDSLASAVQFQPGSFVSSRGTAAITGNVIKWVIGNIAAGGDTVTLTYRVKATQEGVHFNTAEICKTNEQDVDSTPCNNNDDEDDRDRQCFTVPFKLCPGEQVQADVPSTYTNVQWFKEGSSTPIAYGNAVMLAEVGTYTFTASNQSCPTEGCCPIIIETGTNCCPTELCIPFTIKKRKK